MPQNQIVGLALMAVAVIDTTIGNLVILPRIPDPKKRAVLRVVFGASGVLIATLGFALYLGMVALP
jgi:uncharacterized BrkB/YihY/UPF0761 family membrane protein